MTCEDCGEAAELACCDCCRVLCEELLHDVGGGLATLLCAGCMARELAGAS